ncbi:hypothetical protein B296_00006882 [Ensete ventricosum]|uniref:Transposase (putative) gypsy type domain-containing protein n=1 Tax=Ensete ventricosum TaxID=4639 RepID=A0A427AL42_ENSVE|nr:hypothetical protein B296_00006882 [Ensete ventricosum]
MNWSGLSTRELIRPSRSSRNDLVGFKYRELIRPSRSSGNELAKFKYPEVDPIEQGLGKPILIRTLAVWLRLGDPEASPLGASSGPPLLVDARVLRDLKVMKADHDLDTTVTEGSLAVIRERYSIPAEYGLHVPRSGQRPYSSDAPGMCISVDALEVGLRFLLHPLIEECIRWWRISPSQGAPNSWRYLIVFLGECRGAEIIPTRDLFMACFRLCNSRGGYYLTTHVGFRVSRAPSNDKGWKSRNLFVSGPVLGFKLDWSAHPIGNVLPYLSEESVLVSRLKGIFFSSRAIKEMTELWLVEADRMDLDDLRGMPKVSGGKAPAARSVASTQGVDGAQPTKDLKSSSERPSDSPGGSRSHSKGQEPAEPVEEPKTPVDFAEEDASPIFHRPRSMKDLFKMKALESAQAELPKQAIDNYKESAGFKKGLKRVG